MNSQPLPHRARRGPRALIKAVKGMITVSFLGACRSGLPNGLDYEYPDSDAGDAGDAGDADGGDAALFHTMEGAQIADARATKRMPTGLPRDGRSA